MRAETVIRAIELPRDPPSIDRIGGVLSARLKAQYPLSSFRGVARQTRDAARRFWSQRAWSEYSALPVLNQISLRMIREGAPLGELAGASGILQDEALHTRLSFEVAEALGGYTPDIPSHLTFDA